MTEGLRPLTFFPQARAGFGEDGPRNGVNEMEYVRMQQAAADALQAEVQALIEREAAAGADGRDICQAIVEAIAAYAMAVTNDTNEVGALALHMCEVAAGLEAPEEVA